MTPRRHRPTALAPLALLALVVPAAARADAIPIEIAPRGSNRVTIDGVIGDFRRFTELVGVDEAAQVLSGRDHWNGADDASFGVSLARDDQSLYLAAEVRDDTIVRTREHRADDDALVLTLVAPAGPNRSAVYEIAIYPGDPGNFAGVVRFRGARSGVVPGAQIVEAPLRGGGGYTLEVAIPWRALPEVNAGIATARGRVAYQDCDINLHPRVETVMATGPGDPAHPETIPALAGSAANATNDLVALFARQHNFQLTDSFLDRSANIAGDAGVERVVVFQGYAVAAGPGISGGSRFAYVQFPQRQRDDLIEPGLRDVTGDGRQDLILRVRSTEPSGLVREVLTVYGAPNGADQLSQLFAAETARSMGANRVASRATYEGSNGIRITADGGTGFTAQNYPRVAENGVIPALTPWGENRVVVYRWSDAGQRFDVARTEPNQGAAPATPAGATTPGTALSGAMTEAPDAAGVMRNFRNAHGIAESTRPNYSATANFAGDAANELLQIFGRQLVLTGAHFMNGRSFFSIELPASADGDVLGLETVDLSDDAHPEAVVRIRRTQQVQVRGQTLDLVKEYLLVYSLDEAHRGRIFAAEISRRVGGDAIVNAVRLPRGARNRELVIDAGRAVGAWNPQTYPFRDTPMQGFAPLLLPWETPRRVYRFDGTALVPGQ